MSTSNAANRRHNVGALKVGDMVWQHEPTIWGICGEWEIVASIRILAEDLIEVELRKEQVLRHLLVASPADAVVAVAVVA